LQEKDCAKRFETQPKRNCKSGFRRDIAVERSSDSPPLISGPRDQDNQNTNSGATFSLMGQALRNEGRFEVSKVFRCDQCCELSSTRVQVIDIIGFSY
jgi:hypothetical protein